MMLMLLLFISVLANVAKTSTVPIETPQFAQGVRVGKVPGQYVKEASGLCKSRIHDNVLYTHNDLGDTSCRLYAIDARSGNLLAKITIDGATEYDWEDVTCAKCGGGPSAGFCVFIADTGGNSGKNANTVYRIREPAEMKDQHVPLDSFLKFSWDQHNCETIMVDPQGEVYLISKVREGGGKLIKLPSSSWGKSQRTLVKGGVYLNNIPSAKRRGPVSGDISPNGREVLIKTYSHVYYWLVSDSNYFRDLQRQPIELPYTHERQGESVCWNDDGTGYFTLGEGVNAPLYYYHRYGYPNNVIGE